ncbi:TetR/AcrR family transcriptional regulator [Streptomyces sp. NPDC002623]
MIDLLRVTVNNSVDLKLPRRDSRSNRARILAAARRELSRNPDAPLEEIAQAAGVVRRTLFAYFPGRQSLVEALVEEASHDLCKAVEERASITEGPEQALAHLVLSLWDLGGAYQLLLVFERRGLDRERVTEALAVIREEGTAILATGQQAGVFHALAPPAVLSAGIEAFTMALSGRGSSESWLDDGTMTIFAVLVAAGVPEERAAVVIDGIPAQMFARSVADQ